MDIKTSNMISILRYAIKNRKEQELAEYGPDFKSCELAAWESYFDAIRFDKISIIVLTD